MDITSKLPSQCYVFHPTKQRGVIVKRGEVGYYPITADLPTREAVREANAALGVSLSQERAMLHGSMFGFSTPGADPDHSIHDREKNSVTR